MAELSRLRGFRRGRKAVVAGGAFVVGIGLAVQAAVFASPAQAIALTTCTWTGSASTNMSDAANWTPSTTHACGSTTGPGSATLSGNQLIFPSPIPANAPQLDASETPDDVVFQANYDITGASGKTLTLSGTNNSGVAVDTTASSATIGVPVLLAASQTDSVGTHTLTYGSTVDGGSGLTVSGTGSVVFDGSVGGTTNLTSLSVAGATTIGGAVVHTTGTQLYAGVVSLTASSNLIGTTVTFDAAVSSAVSGASGLTVTGTAVFNANAGSPNELASLHVTGTSALDGSVATGGTQAYDGAVTLDTNSTLAGSTVTFGSTLNGIGSGAQSLTVTGNAVFGGTVGGTEPLSSLSVSGSSAINGSAVTSTVGQTYSGATTISLSTVTLVAPTVTFGSSLDGASSVTPSALSITGDGVFDGSVNANHGLKTLNVSGKASTATAFSMNGTASYNVVIAGTGAGNWTQVTVGNSGGVVSLGSATLNVSFAGTFTSVAGNSFDILVNNTGSAITGTFAGLPQGGYVGGGHRIFQISYTGGTSTHDVVLTDVTPIAPTMTAAVGSPSVVYGGETGETFTATLTGASNLPPTGTVSFTSGTTPLCSTIVFTKVNQSQETASCSLTASQLPVGATYPVTASYSGDSSYKSVAAGAPTSFAVTKDTTTATVTPTVTSVTYGSEQQDVFDVTVTTGHGEVLPAAGEAATVTVGTASCHATLTPAGTGGTGNCSLPPTALNAGGPYTIGVSYPGDNDLQSSASTASQSLTVSPASTTTRLSISRRIVTFGRESAIVLTVHVSATGATPSGVVTVSSSDGRLCTVHLSGGSGTCSPGRTQLRAGVYGGLRAHYGGTSDFSSSSTSIGGTFTVDRDTTSVRLSLSSPTAAYGSEHSVVFSVSVSTTRGERVPNGEKVTVSVGSVRCTVMLHDGKARCRIPNTALTPGSYSVVASYGGDFGRLASKSKSASFTVT